MHKASFYRSVGEHLRCDLCSHHCTIPDGRRGKCGVRLHQDGVLYSLNYGKLVAENVDPVEKKPLFHVLPGSLTYSISTLGCNFTCKHCQNHTISQVPSGGQITGRERSAKEIIDSALRAGCQSVSYTYVEPTVFYEFAYDCCLAAHEKGLKNLFVSNGYMASGPAEQISPVLDAINIDIKGFTNEFYTKVAGAKLQPVLDCVERMVSLGVWVEITTLIIPGLNDSVHELEGLAKFLAGLRKDIPWHLTAFHPTYKMTDRYRTSRESLLRAQEIGRSAGLQHVYLGNLGGGGQDTNCNNCAASLIQRSGFVADSAVDDQGCCQRCKAPLSGVWWGE